MSVVDTVRRLTRGSASTHQASLRRASSVTVVLSALTLVINLATGVMSSRGLHASGRGELAASLSAAQFFGWLASIGGRQALGYRIAGHRGDPKVLLATWLAMIPFFGLIAIVICEVLLPALFAAQSARSLADARVFVIAMLGVLTTEVVTGSVLGHQEFVRWNVYRFMQPVLLVISYVVLSLVGLLTTRWVLAANALALTVPPIMLVTDQIVRHGISAPSWTEVKRLLSFGGRSHLGMLSSAVNGRLDVLVAPSVLAASVIGYYAVAVNIDGMILVVTGTLNYLTLPAARRAGADAAATVRNGVLLSLSLGLAGAVFLLATGSFLVPLVYGHEFRRSIAPMFALLPGTILLSPANTLIAGIEALGRPGLGSVPQGFSVVITVVGLWLFLASGGAMAAAIVSSIAYSTTFFVSLWIFYRLVQRQSRPGIVLETSLANSMLEVAESPE